MRTRTYTSKAFDNQRSHRRLAFYLLQQPVLVTSGLITGIILGVRLLGWFQPLDVVVFDQMMRLQPKSLTDSRLLIVEITESDIATFQQWPLPDRVVAQTLEELQQYQPRAIGLDLYRDIPQPPGHADLLKQLQAPNVIAIESYGSAPLLPVCPKIESVSTIWYSILME